MAIEGQVYEKKEYLGRIYWIVQQHYCICWYVSASPEEFGITFDGERWDEDSCYGKMPEDVFYEVTFAGYLVKRDEQRQDLVKCSNLANSDDDPFVIGFDPDFDESFTVEEAREECINIIEQLDKENKKMNLEKENKLMYQSLKEISDINSAILTGTDDNFNGLDVSYLAGVIEGSFDLIKELVGDRYEEKD